MRNTLEGKKRRLGDTEEHVSDLEDRRMQIIHYKNSKKKGKFKNENSLNGLWGNIKHINHQVPEVPEETEDDKICIWWNYGWQLPKTEKGNISRKKQHRESHPKWDELRDPHQDKS